MPVSRMEEIIQGIFHIKPARNITQSMTFFYYYFWIKPPTAIVERTYQKILV